MHDYASSSQLSSLYSYFVDPRVLQYVYLETYHWFMKVYVVFFGGMWLFELSYSFYQKLCILSSDFYHFSKKWLKTWLNHLNQPIAIDVIFQLVCSICFLVISVELQPIFLRWWNTINNMILNQLIQKRSFWAYLIKGNFIQVCLSQF